MGFTGILKPHVLDKMSVESRKPLGRAGLTTAECDERQIKQAEKLLQEQIRGLLNTQDIDNINPPMHKKSEMPLGWPDHTFAYRGVPVAIECKVVGQKPKPHQAERMESMRRNGWTVIVAYDVTDAQKLLRAIDANPPVIFQYNP